MMMAACEHGHLTFVRDASKGLPGYRRALCVDCGADVTDRERRADYWRQVFDRMHPYEVVGPDGPVAQFSEAEWWGERVCRCGDVVQACPICQGSELAVHDSFTLSAWHRAGHPSEP